MPKLPTREIFQQSLPIANKFLNFVNSSKSAFHSVNTIRSSLEQHGFKQINEKDNWKDQLQLNGKYFFTRNQSTIVCFQVGGKFKAGNGLKIIGAHTDSPDLRIKPKSNENSEGYLQVGVEVYGGVLLHTWFDRDLTVAGRVFIKSKDKDGPYKYEHRLVEIKKPILRIPNIAIHLYREVNDKGFKFNKEKQILPILATALEGELDKKDENSHHPVLMNLLAKELECEPSDILDFELSVVDTQPAAIGGANDEFIFSPRLDNLMSCFCAMEAMYNAENTLKDDEDIRLLALFDHEEIGSRSGQGAASSLLRDTFERLTNVLSDENTPVDALESCFTKSFIISADMAHAVHPNYADKHQKNHKPMMHQGPVIKVNSNQRYATTAYSSLVLKELAKRQNVPCQEFVVRNDMACGSTIGPITASNCGVKTVDIGIAQLSMHSIREMCGTVDVKYTIDTMTSFFNEYRKLQNEIKFE